MGKTKEVKVKKSAEAAAPKTVKAAATPSKKSAKVSKKSKKEESSSESESEEESASEASADSEDSDDSESEAEEKPKTKTNGAKAKKEESDSDSDDSDDSADEKEESTDKSDVQKDSDSENDSDDSDESDAEDKKTEEEPSKKRKADDEEPAAAKKAKTEEEGETSSTLFVGNLSWNVDDSVLYDEFKGFDGLTGARVITDRETQRSRGFGYVEFDSVEHAQAAFDKMTGYFLDGRELKIDFSTGRAKSNDANPAASRAKKYGDVTSPESDTLFVGNLSFDADEETVSAFFSEVANVKSLRLPTDMESGRPKGFGYVSFYSLEDSKKAFDTLNGQSCAGRNVRLDYSTPKPRTEFGGDRGGRGGRGRGGGFGGGRGGGGGFGGRGRGGGDRGGRGRGGFGGRGGGGFAGKKTTF